MFLFQILSRLVYVVPACMLRGTFLGSYHTETHHYSPLLLQIKIIIVKLSILRDTSGKMHHGILYSIVVWYIHTLYVKLSVNL